MSSKGFSYTWLTCLAGCFGLVSTSSGISSYIPEANETPDSFLGMEFFLLEIQEMYFGSILKWKITYWEPSTFAKSWDESSVSLPPGVLLTTDMPRLMELEAFCQKYNK